ncbi:carboxymuconolactone decarboxylase family protein [Actinacidiphila rubida]|uniref:Alkylhydroperoxidase AhpD family core domain-containing protein n=1 Tax=Actinacidiphila rubida TaxID=310780 RepID=A0A1H8PUC2_9ACTN|nr:carboxymuconolactone decarboxylase family protein [Actinacidiphila rubida]SEO45612.1 alkylhydroperoxidase AhpD family core domain-containing protein [Actinacidiphila rubida]
MDDVARENARQRVFIDKQSPGAYRSFRESAAVVRSVAADAGLERILVELINLRVSQINGCAYCLSTHTTAALEAGEDVRRLGVLPAWRDTELFSPSERAALALAEATTSPSDATAQEAAYASARAVLTDDEISAVIWVAITINAFNRVSILSKHPVRPRPVRSHPAP